MGVRARLLGSYAMIIALMVCSVGAGIWGLSALHREARVTDLQTVPYLTRLAEASTAAKAAAVDERGYLLSADGSFSAEFDTHIAAANAALAGASVVASGADQRAAVAGVSTGLNSWVDLVRSEFLLYKTNRAQAVALSLGANRDARKAFEARVDSATKLAAVALASSISAQDSARRLAQLSLLGVLAVAVTVALTIAVRMSRRVTVPLREMQMLLTAGAGGDLTGRASHRSQDEFGIVADALNAMFDSLRATLVGVGETAQTVATEAEGLSKTNSQVAAAAAESAGQADVVAGAAERVSLSVQTVAAGAEQMGASIAEIAKSANEAAKVAGRATGVVAATSDVVAKLGCHRLRSATSSGQSRRSPSRRTCSR